jgi:hypothetical protein
MPIDPVQSIRVANNLAERFGALITPGSMTVAELELKIGEAQQLYPEIWRHLDDARTALAARGTDVSTFDHMRRDELAHLGVTNIDSYTTLDYGGLMMGRLGTAQVKTATFNVAGYRRALEACRALMTAMPEVDWKAVAHEEEREMRAAGSLQTAKWTGTAKLIVMAAAVLGVGILVHRLAMNIEDEAPPSRPERRQQEAKREAQQHNFERIAELRRIYAGSCDRAIKYRLVQAVREVSPTEAEKIENAPCVVMRPSCDGQTDAIGARVAAAFELVKDDTWRITCAGILMVRGGAVEAGLAVVVSAKDRSGHTQTLRGVTSIDGARDLVMFGSAPGTRLAGAGDLDQETGDELVFVDSTSLTISSIKGPGFADIEGPPLPSGCAADTNVEGDFRNGRKGETKLLVLTVPDDVKGKRCLRPGRHYFALRDGELVETN